MTKIVITGLGSFSALGSTFDKTWQKLKSNQCAITALTPLKREYLGVNYAGVINDDHSFNNDSSEHWLDRYLKLARYSLQDAIQSSRVNLTQDLTESRVMVVSGTAVGGYTTVDTCYDNFLLKNRKRVSAYFNISSQSYALSAYIAQQLKLPHTTGLTINASCATGIYALQLAVERIQSGLCDIAFITVADSPFNRMVMRSFQTMRALSDDPTCGAHNLMQPFDRARCGFVLSEGAATLIIESYQHAKNRGAPIYGQILGIKSTIDYHHWTSPHPQGNSIFECMHHLLGAQFVHLKKDDHIYINAHGTATQLGDESEGIAIKRLAKDISGQFYVSSTKGHTGHMLSATGLLEVMFTLKSLQENIFVQTRNLTHLDPLLGQSSNVKYKSSLTPPFTFGLSNSIGFGGFNGSILLKAASSVNNRSSEPPLS